MAPTYDDDLSDHAAPTPDGLRWSRIAEDLAAAIGSGAFAEGAVLPSAAEVASRYGVHRHTARQAYRHLQDLGLVSVERGRGTIVRARRVPYRIGRRVSFRANIGAAGAAATGEVVAASVLAADAAVAARLGIGNGVAVWQVRTVSRAAGVPISTSLHHLEAARFPRFDQRLRAARASITAAFASYGIGDYVRLATRLSARIATSEEVRLLELDGPAPVMQSLAVDGLPDRSPLQAIDATFAGDRVEMVIEADEP